MKTKIITSLKKELLVIELPTAETKISIGLHCIGIKPPPIGKDASDINGYYHIYTEMFHGFKLLGSPDEIKEDNVRDLVEIVGEDDLLGVFYKNYKMISTLTSTKQLMKDILKTRKTVHYYVYYNLIMIVLSLVAGFYMAFAFNPEVSVLKDKIASDPKAMAIVVGLLTLVTLVFFGVFWLFYRLLYGTLLRKLYANYNELKKIDL